MTGETKGPRLSLDLGFPLRDEVRGNPRNFLISVLPELGHDTACAGIGRF
jgi:hypothetical protein